MRFSQRVPSFRGASAIRGYHFSVVRTLVVWSFVFFTCADFFGKAQAGTTVNLSGADIRLLIKTVSEVTGKNFLIDPTVQGQVTIVSSVEMSNEELYQTFLSSLAVLGYSAVEDHNIVKIIPDANAKYEGNTTLFPRGGEVTTKIVPLRRASASAVANLLKSLAPQWAQVVPAPNNTLIISDRSNNITRFEAIISELDGAPDFDTEIAPVQYLSTGESLRLVNQFIQQTKSPDSPPSMLSVFADERSNTLVVAGSKAERERVIRLIGQLDKPIKSDGSSTQIIYLRNARAEQINAPLEALAQRFRPAASTSSVNSGAMVIPDKTLNAIILSGSIEFVQEIRNAIEQLDIRRAQVVVEVVVAEISREKSQELGVNWALIDGKQVLAASISSPGVLGALRSIGAASSDASTASVVNLGLNIAGVTINKNGTSLAAVLNAIKGEGSTNILSSPSIVTLDNEEAQVIVGQEVPFLTGSFTGNGATSAGGVNPFQTIERKDVGIKLSVTPQVNSGSSVLLKIKLEVSSVAAGASGAADLITNKRSLSDTVSVDDGQILVLGGLVDDSYQQNTRGVPLLSAIPVFGSLFRSKSTSATKRNLMIFLVPHILQNSEQSDYFTSKKYEQFRRRMPEAARFLDDNVDSLKQ